MTKESSTSKTVGILNNGKITKYTPESVTLMQAAFANAFTVEQACIYASISKVTHYTWLEKYPSYAKQIEKAKEQVGFKAKQVVVGAVNKGDLETSKWWLKHKHGDEFGNIQQTNVQVNFNSYTKDQRKEYGI